MTQSLHLSTPLAVAGGHPVRTKPFAPWPHLEPDQIQVVIDVLRSGKLNYWTGEEGRLFEKEYAASFGSKFAVAVANGSLALELALHALGVGSGDEVIVPSRTFIASASCVVMRGAKPIFADIDPDSQTLTASTVRCLISPHTRAIIAVHLAGWSCEMDSLLALADDHGLTVIEDCAQAHGATYKGRSVGSFGNASAFSFCQDKILTTGGEGGMVLTNDENVWKRAWSYKDHGKSYSSVYERSHAPGFRWLHESFGTNWRLTEMQSALGRVLLRSLSEQVEIRRRNASILTTAFCRIPSLRVTCPPPDIGHSYYKYCVFVRPEKLKFGWNRDRVIEAIVAEGVFCNIGSCSEVYLEKAFPREFRPPERLKNAKELGETCMTFLVHPTLSVEDMLDTCRAVEKVMDVASR